MSEIKKKPRLRFAEAVESGVEGFLLFLVRYFWTGISIIASPRRSLRRLLADRHAIRPKYVLPLTYLAVGLFLLSLLGQVAGTLIFDWIWFTSDLAEKVTDALNKEISLVKVTVQALPGIVIVSFFIFILKYLTRTRAPISNCLVQFVLSYAFGAQAFLLFIITFVYVVMATIGEKWVPPAGEYGANFFAVFVYGVLFSGLVAAFACPLVFVFNALGLKRLWRKNHYLGLAIFLTTLVALIFGHMCILYAGRLPAMVIQRAKGSTSPEVNVSDGTYWIEDNTAKVRISFTIRNRSSSPISWETQKINLRLHPIPATANIHNCQAEALQFSSGRIVDGAGVERRFASIDPSQTQWFEAVVTRKIDDVTREIMEKPSKWGVNVVITTLNGEAVIPCAIRTIRNGQSDSMPGRSD